MKLNYISINNEISKFKKNIIISILKLYDIKINLEIIVDGRDFMDYRYIDTALAGFDIDNQVIYLNLPVIDKHIDTMEEFRYLLIHEVSHYINLLLNGVNVKNKDNNYGHDDNFNNTEDSLCSEISVPVKKINYDILGFSKVRKYSNSDIKVYENKDEFNKVHPNFKPGKIIYDF